MKNKIFCYIKNRGVKGLIFSLFIALVFFTLSITKAFLSLDNSIMDLYQKPNKASNITIIAIDDKTLDKLGNPFADGNISKYRTYYTQVLNNLYGDDKKKPIVTGMDVLLSGPTEEEIDNNLFEAINKDGRNIIVANQLNFKDSVKGNNNSFTVSSHIDSVSYPYKDAKSGFVNNILDSDGYSRRLISYFYQDDKIYESFSYKIYKEYALYNGFEVNAYEKNTSYRFKYTEKPGSDYSIISFYDIWSGNIKPNLSDEIVMIGAYATGLMDDFFTPIDKTTKMNGVEVHANMVDAYIKNDVIYEANYVLLSFLTLFILFIISFVIYKSHIAISSGVSGGGIIIFILIQSLLFKAKIYSPFNVLILGILVSYVGILIVNYLIELIKRRRTVNIFKKYVAKEVVEKALKDSDNKIELGGIKKDIAVMFIDIRGFTTLSEALEPQQIVEILNRYLEITSSEILAVGGTLDKFIGDATMAVFNSPFDLPDYEYKAVLAANNIRKRAKELEDECMKLYNKTVRFGIGVNVGEAVVGNIGSQKRMDFTAIGDTVNTASRLEGKALGGEIVISKALKDRLDDRVVTEFKDNLQLKGKAEFVESYRVLDVLTNQEKEGEKENEKDN